MRSADTVIWTRWLPLPFSVSAAHCSLCEQLRTTMPHPLEQLAPLTPHSTAPFSGPSRAIYLGGRAVICGVIALITFPFSLFFPALAGPLLFLSLELFAATSEQFRTARQF